MRLNIVNKYRLATESTVRPDMNFIKKMMKSLISLLFLVSSIRFSKALKNETLVLKGSLRRDTVNKSGYAGFVKHKNSYLHVSVALKGFVRRAGECAFVCANSSIGFSFNFAINPDIHGRHVCEILATDKYNASDKFSCKLGFNHYSIYSPCSSFPCRNGATCKAIYEENKYECLCKPGHNGVLCENSTDYEVDVALRGHSYKNLTASNLKECLATCLNECRCMSYQLFGTRCELLAEDRNTAPADFVPTPGYKYSKPKPTMTQMSLDCSTSGTPAPVMSANCTNGCCKNISCLNGGTCIEQCGNNVRPKFKCLCIPGIFTGRLCEKLMTCAAHGKGLVSGLYPITSPSGHKMNVYCDFHSQQGFVWTLIESFAFAVNKLKYQTKGFVTDFPINQDTFNWTDYRLSRSVMLHIRSNSTLFRATCKYETDGLVMRDYIRGLLTNFDIMMHASGTICAHVQYINVRGINCTECTSCLHQNTLVHANVNSGYGVYIGCQWDGSQGMKKITYQTATGTMTYFDQSFGSYYDPVNPAHRCSSSPSSTTQWWLGTPEYPG